MTGRPVTARERVVVSLPHDLGSILEAARNRGFRAFAVAERSPTEARPGEQWWFRSETELRPFDGTAPVRRIRVGASGELREAEVELAAGRSISVRWSLERILPLESLVAVPHSGTELWAEADALAEVPSLLGALERGADRALVPVLHVEELDRLLAMLPEPLHDLDWTDAEVSRVESVGLGDRILVDTVSLLDPEEGLLVGSAAAYLFHVASEALGSRFTRPRPFRVNAGAAHSYCLLASGETRYLSELEPGDAVHVTRPGQAGKLVRVGRLKIERRPLRLLEVVDAGRRRTLFVQDAETVRLSTQSGPRGVGDLRPGDRVRGVRLPPARHLGATVEELVEER